MALSSKLHIELETLLVPARKIAIKVDDFITLFPPPLRIYLYS